MLNHAIVSGGMKQRREICLTKMYGGPDGKGERVDVRTGSWAGMGRARRPDQMASGIHRGAAARAADENANRTKARATRDARTTRAGATRGQAK